jgi:putative phosphoesterase
MMNKNKVKIGVLSDTHISGYDENLKKIIEEHFSDVDLIFHAGDLVDLSVLTLFGDKEVRAVCGNMDNHRVREELPQQLLMDINGFKIGLIHGWGSPSGIERKLLGKLGKLDCIVFGHTHYPEIRTIDGVYFFNPGSAVDKRFAKSRSIGILEVGPDLAGRIITIK